MAAHRRRRERVLCTPSSGQPPLSPPAAACPPPGAVPGCTAGTIRPGNPPVCSGCSDVAGTLRGAGVRQELRGKPLRKRWVGVRIRVCCGVLGGRCWFGSGFVLLRVGCAFTVVCSAWGGRVLLTSSSAPQIPPGLGAGCHDSSRKSCGLEMGSEQEGLECPVSQLLPKRAGSSALFGCDDFF